MNPKMTGVDLQKVTNVKIFVKKLTKIEFFKMLTISTRFWQIFVFFWGGE